MSEPCVAICLPMYEGPTPHTWRSYLNLHKPGGGLLPGKYHRIDTTGVQVEKARMMLTDEALNVKETTHVLFIDDDMEFPPNALERLLSWDLDIVGGLCHSRRPPYQPTLMRKHHASWGLPGDTYGFVYDFPEDSRFEVDATGGAFLLIKRHVFEAMKEKLGKGDPNWADWWVPEGESSEDISFCERARECGFKIHVDTGLEIGHVAQVVVNKTVAKRLRDFSWAKWNPALTVEQTVTGTPRASIIIPTFNQEPRFLKAAVMSALAQSVAAEVIVVDDGTTNYTIGHTDAMVGPCVRLSKEARIIRHESNQGIAAALNTGIEAMSTEWFCWLSSDDLFDPHKVETQLLAMSQARAKASFHGYNSIDKTGFGFRVLLPHWNNDDEQRAALGKVCCINGSTVMIHKSVFADVGRFDPSYRYGQDWEMWCRIGEKYRWHKVDETLGTRREGGNLTQLIAAEPLDSPRRKLRDEEDKRIKERYGVKQACPKCGEPLV